MYFSICEGAGTHVLRIDTPGWLCWQHKILSHFSSEFPSCLASVGVSQNPKPTAPGGIAQMTPEEQLRGTVKYRKKNAQRKRTAQGM